VNRYLQPGQRLYDGATIKVEMPQGVKTKASVIEKKLKPLATPKRNKHLFGKPYRVWWWYIFGQPKKEKGFKTWLRNTLGEPPVFGEDLNPELNAQNMQSLLESEGYFNSQVLADTTFPEKRIKLFYLATVKRPYMLGHISWRTDSSQLAKDLLNLPKEGSLLKTGDQYNEQKIKAEKERLVQGLKGKGYYYFEAGHLLTYIDTNHNNYTATIFMGLNQPLPVDAQKPYTINRVVVQTAFTTFQPLPDSLVLTLRQQDGVYIYDSSKKFKPDIFSRSITFRTGSLYSLPEQNRIQMRLYNLGAFRFIKPQFAPAADSSSMNVTYYLAPYQKRKLQTEIGGFSRSNNYTGGQVSVQWADKNIFKRAESLVIKATGSFEITPNDSLKDNNNWRLGLEATLNIPKLMVPFRTNHQKAIISRTSFPLSFDWVRHEDLYTEKYLHLRYELNWRDTSNREFKLSPFSLTITNTANFTNAFQIREALDSLLKYTQPTILIPSLGFQYIVARSLAGKRHSTYLYTGVEFAGNILGMVKGNNGYFSTKVAGAYFAQYVKAAVDFRYYQKLGSDASWASRIILGTSYPYGNSPFLPFSRQYIIGGASSLRGFLPRKLGPGSAQATEIQQSTFPQIGGDYKLELNTELRGTLTGRLKGAIFMDAGNIWMKDSILYKKAGQLTKEFYKQVAFDGGIGLRVDMDIIVVRLDLALPFYKPWLPQGQRWTFSEMKWGDPDWRKENLVWNLALGYPF
jgi:outer membrane protein assembly factor BamA